MLDSNRWRAILSSFSSVHACYVVYSITSRLSRIKPRFILLLNQISEFCWQKFLSNSFSSLNQRPKCQFIYLHWQVNQKMILTLTASIMYWSLQQQPAETSESAVPTETAAEPTELSTEDTPSEIIPPSSDHDKNVVTERVSNLAVDNAISVTSETSRAENENSIQNSK